jgi:hypothetical protein
MDHWGDPWADNADEQQPPTKPAVTSPLPPTHTTAPVLLNGFLDDAGWGNDDDAFGEWATSAPEDDAPPARSETRAAEATAVEHLTQSQDHVEWESEEITERHGIYREAEDVWPTKLEDARDVDKVPSETSDSSTTIQLDDTPNRTVPEYAGLSQADDGSSARPSTSPSERSHYEPPSESPRTSIEDDRGVVKPCAGEHVSDEDQGSGDIPTQEDMAADDGSIKGTEGTSTHEAPRPAEIVGPPNILQDDSHISHEDAKENIVAHTELASVTTPVTVVGIAQVDSFTVDTALLDELFPASETMPDCSDAPEDPIYSTAGRKAWYRLTRKQTLREYNSGNGDDNYIRVTWTNSHIRSEVNKIVGGWAREDRLSGKGPGARASFYWDTPAPADNKNPSSHSRTKTTISTPRVPAPARQSLPPISASTTAAFNWSSPIASVYPWKQDSPTPTSSFSSLASTSNAVETVQEGESRPVDVEVASQHVLAETSGPTSTIVSETLVVTDSCAQPLSKAPAASSNPWNSLSNFDTDTSVPKNATSAPPDDEDDWGEMVTSPTFAPAVPFEADALTLSANSNSWTVKSAPHSVKHSPNQGATVDPMHASPIVRLRSTISPTSAIFGAKGFVPLGVEQGPIGPGILKSIDRGVSSTIESSPTPVPSTSSENVTAADKTPEVAITQLPDTSVPEVHDTENDEFSAFTSSTLPYEPTRPSTPAPSSASLVDFGVDSWANTDFSVFESAPPSIGAQHQSKNDRTDPFSVFETPLRPASAASSAKTFTRSPPRNVTPPPVQPLTGATNSAQRRKGEEEQTIKDILHGLPDLAYMLR